MAQDEIRSAGEAQEKTQAGDPVAAVSYKAARFTVMGKERFFVIPSRSEIWELASESSLTISDEIMAQTPTWSKALMVAYALNYNRLMKATLEKDRV